jgi:hypothetical protein
MARVKITKFVLHDVDRDPRNGIYGGNRIWTTTFGDLEIVTFDEKSGYVDARTLELEPGHILLEIDPTEKTDRNMLFETLLKPWRDYYQQRYYGDTDYTDYKPYYFDTLQDMRDKKGHFVADDSPLYNMDQNNDVCMCLCRAENTSLSADGQL